VQPLSPPDIWLPKGKHVLQSQTLSCDAPPRTRVGRTLRSDSAIGQSERVIPQETPKPVGASNLLSGRRKGAGQIAENTPLDRQRIGEGLRWCGLEMDEEQNPTVINIEGRLSTRNSPIQAYVIPVEETLQIAHECSQAIQSSQPGGRRNRVPDNRSIDRIARCSKATSKRRDASISGMIRKLKSGQFRLYSRKKNPSTGKRRNLGTFSTLDQAKQHEREVQYFKKH
jgi:hypothetical protein